jgi:hypothetical protein
MDDSTNRVVVVVEEEGEEDEGNVDVKMLKRNRRKRSK